MLPKQSFHRGYGSIPQVIFSVVFTTTVLMALLGERDVAIVGAFASVWALVGVSANRWADVMVLTGSGWHGKLGELRIRRLVGWWTIPRANIGAVTLVAEGETRSGIPQWRLTVITTGGQTVLTPVVVRGWAGEKALAEEFGSEAVSQLLHRNWTDTHYDDIGRFALDA